MLSDLTTSFISADPPSYTPTVRQPSPLTYRFTEWGTDHIALMPPTELRHPQTSAGRPLYHVTTALKIHPLTPISYVTKVSKGAEGEEVLGSFEMSLYHKRAAVTVGTDRPQRLANVLQSIEGSKKHWTWRYTTTHLVWDCRSPGPDGAPVCTCLDPNNNKPLAVFIPTPTDPDYPAPEAVLKVYPEGHHVLDHILLSALAVERKRMLAF